MLKLTRDYSIAGDVHNLILDKVSQLPSFPNFSLEEVYYLGVKISQEHLNLKKSIDLPKYEVVKPFYEQIQKNVEALQIINMLDKHIQMDIKFKEEVERLNSIIINAEDIEKLEPNITEYIKSIEENSNLSNENEMICISAGYIAIASKNYWVDAINNKDNPWNGSFGGEIEEKKNPKRWKSVARTVAYDVAGGIIGGALGSVLSPVGTIAGISVVGAGASAAANKD